MTLPAHVPGVTEPCRREASAPEGRTRGELEGFGVVHSAGTLSALSTEQIDPRLLVRTVVCAYRGDELPTSWLQVFHRFEHTLKRAGLRIRVRLEPLDALPETYEVVVVAPDLEEDARVRVKEARVLTATRESAAAVAQDLARELTEGPTLYAERARPDEPVVVVHRGPEVL